MIKHSVSIIFGLMAALSACGQPPAGPASPFDYDPTVPFDVQVNQEGEREGVIVQDLSYAAHDPGFSESLGGRTLAYLVRPEGDGPFAGVIYLHWLGPSNSGRGQYLDEAVILAQRGAMVLLLQGQVPWMNQFRGTEADRAMIAGQVVELRRAVDFLLSQPEVDSDRLAFVGHDYGAMYGGTLAGVEDRIKAYVLIAGVPSFADWGSVWGFAVEDYLPILDGIDPVQIVAEASPSSLFFQFGERDQWVSQDQANRYFEAARQPKQIGWYDDMHAMSSEAVRQDRLDWLAEQLGLPASGSGN